MIFKPQDGPQTDFFFSDADIVIFGGSAGGGKSYALLIEALRHRENPRFGCYVFRRTMVQIKVEGGLWDTSQEIYPFFGARGFSQGMRWLFPSGATVRFAGMEHEKDRFVYQGAQIPYIAFDELTHFTEKQFWYMLARNRSMSGVPGYIRAACNPDPDSWVKHFIQWWLNPKTGLAIPARSGVIRWMWRVGDTIHWGFEREELVNKFGPKCIPKSVTFIRSSIYDNPILLESDPAYLANLMALPTVDREQLLNGNWEVRPAAGTYFKRHYFGIVDEPPADVIMRVRFWDRAASQKLPGTDPDATAGLKLSKARNGLYYIEDVQRMFESPYDVERAILATASMDGKATVVGFRQDPGSAGVFEAQQLARALEGYTFNYDTVTGDKESNIRPVSSQAQAGNIKIVRGPWNETLIRELENFPMGRYDDQADALSGAFERIAKGVNIFVA